MHRGYSFPHVLSSLIFVHIAMKMHAQIISDKIPPLSDCSQVFLVVITIMLQLNIHPNNFYNKVMWISGNAGSDPSPGVDIPKW